MLKMLVQQVKGKIKACAFVFFKSSYYLQMIIFIQMKKSEKDNQMPFQSCIVWMVSQHYVFSTSIGVKKNIAIIIFPVYVYLGLHNMLLIQNRLVKRCIIKKRKQRLKN